MTHKLFYKILIITILFSILFTPFKSFAKDQTLGRSQWETSSCIKASLGVNEKINKENTHHIKYFVKNNKNMIFIAERNIDNSSPATFSNTSVTFPDDFHWIAKNGENMAAFIDCNSGDQYYWSIQIDENIVDHGIFSFYRKQLNNKE